MPPLLLNPTLLFFTLPDLSSICQTCSQWYNSVAINPSLWDILHSRLAGGVYASASGANGKLKLQARLRQTAEGVIDRCNVHM